MMNMGKRRQGRVRKETNYEEAMKEAFREIFQNIKEIEKDRKIMQRQRVNLEMRRESVPVTAIRETTTALKKQPKELFTRKLSAPIPPRPSLSAELPRKLSTPLPPKPSLSTMQWILTCCEEEEDFMMN